MPELLQLGPPFDPELFLVLPVMKTILFTVAGVIIGWPIARALARRLDRPPTAAQLPTDLGARLDRIEHAVDAMAVEVERISEGQRWVTKVLSERTGPAGGAGERLPPGARPT